MTIDNNFPPGLPLPRRIITPERNFHEGKQAGRGAEGGDGVFTDTVL